MYAAFFCASFNGVLFSERLKRLGDLFHAGIVVWFCCDIKGIYTLYIIKKKEEGEDGGGEEENEKKKKKEY